MEEKRGCKEKKLSESSKKYPIDPIAHSSIPVLKRVHFMSNLFKECLSDDMYPKV